MPNPFSLSRVGRQTLIYGAGTLLSKAAAILMLPLYTHYLAPSGYGVLSLIQITLEIVSIFAGAVIVGGVFRFFFKAETEEDRQAVVWTALVILSISYGTAALATFVAAPRISASLFGAFPDGAWLIRISAGALAGEGLLLVPFAYLRVRERSRLFVVMSLLKLGLQLVLNIVFLIPLAMGVAAILLSTLISNLLFAMLLTWFMLRDIRFRLSWDATRSLLRFGVPLIGTTLAMFALHYGDRYFLQAVAGAATVGIYALAYQFGFAFLALANEPFLMVWEPLRFKVAEHPDHDRIYARCFIYLNLALVTLGTLLALFAYDLLRVVATPAFRSAADLVPIILTAYLFHAWTNFHSVGALVTERTEMITLTNCVAAAAALFLYWLWIPRLGAMGAALATLVAFSLRWALLYVVSQRLWRVQYAWREVLLLGGAGSATVAIGKLIGRDTFAESVGLRLILFSVYLVVVWSLPILSDGDRAMVRRLGKEPRLAVAKLLG
jgi:O-antigen/teichoic acid export membrane protein